MNLLKSALAVMFGLSCAGAPVYAQTEKNNNNDDIGHITVDASQVELRDSYAGGQVSRGGRVDNVFDNNYWASVGGFPGSNYLVLSEPRTFRLSASFNF